MKIIVKSCKDCPMCCENGKRYVCTAMIEKVGIAREQFVDVTNVKSTHKRCPLREEVIKLYLE